MLFGCKGKLGRGAPAVHLNIVVFIRTIGHIISRRVRNACQHIGELGIQLFCLILHRSNFGFFLRDGLAQALKLCFVAFGLSGTNGFGGFILFSLGFFGGLDFGAAFPIQSQDLRRNRRIPTPRQSGVKGGWIFADCANVVHGSCS